MFDLFHFTGQHFTDLKAKQEAIVNRFSSHVEKVHFYLRKIEKEKIVSEDSKIALPSFDFAQHIKQAGQQAVARYYGAH